MKTTRLAVAFLALLSVWLAVPMRVGAQSTTTAPTTTTLATTTTTTTTTTTSTTTTSTTTTTTTSTTTTTLISTQEVTGCHVVADQPLGSGYHVAGYFIGAASYRTGGMIFGIPNTMKVAGRCLCNSVARVPMTVIFNTSAGIMFEPAPYPSSVRPTGLTVEAFSAAGTEVTATTPLSSDLVEFWSVCK